MNLRLQVEQDLQTTLESDFKLPVILIDPDGNTYDKSANEPLEDLTGQIMFDTILQNPETGQEIISNKPVVTLRRSSLARIPSELDYSKWFVKIPLSVLTGAAIITMNLLRPPEGGKSHGFIRLYLGKAVQV